jgi:hypothetical protein
MVATEQTMSGINPDQVVAKQKVDLPNFVDAETQAKYDEALAKRQVESFKRVRARSLVSDDKVFADMESKSERDEPTGRLLRSPIGGDIYIDNQGQRPTHLQTKVRFTNERIFSAHQTELTGEPTYIIKEFITIIPPRLAANGGMYSKDYHTAHAQVTGEHKWRFPKEYAAFKEGKQKLILAEDTPLSQWSAIQAYADIVEIFATIGIQTVKDLAQTSEVEGKRHLVNFGEWRDKAKLFIKEVNKSEDEIVRDKKLSEQEQKIAALTEQVDKLLAALSQTQKSTPVEPVKSKSSYKRKTKVAATPAE